MRNRDELDQFEDAEEKHMQWVRRMFGWAMAILIGWGIVGLLIWGATEGWKYVGR